MKFTDLQLIEAVEQACREATFAFAGLLEHVKNDDGAVVHHGGMTPRIAYILGANDQMVRRRLATMHKKGLMKRHQGRGNGTIRWWPVGLFDRVSAGKEVSQPAN